MQKSSHPGSDLPKAILRQAARLADQQERLSADSPCVPFASGIRGALLKILSGHKADAGCGSNGITADRLASILKLIEGGSRLLPLAVKEIPET